MKAAARFAFVAALLPLIVWWSLALYLRLQLPGPPWMPAAAAVAYAVGTLALLVLVRPLRRALAVFAAVFAALLFWWSGIEPSNDRDWLPDVAQIPSGDLRGDLLALRNVRNFDYRSETDFVPRYEERTYDLSRLVGIDMFLSYWGSPYIAHTIVSWEFDDGQHLAVSIETRKEKGEEYSALRGFFREYELCYVAADERDVVRLRTDYRGEQVYLYRLAVPVERARAALLDYVQAMNRLAARPQFYNALTDNCTTTIQMHNRHVNPNAAFDWRIVVNGYLDQLMYERGTADRSLPFAELRARSLIDERARAADAASDFSARIREGLPPRPVPRAAPEGSAARPREP